MEQWYGRTELLMGAQAVQRLHEARVLLVGVGGVGAAVAETLTRAGVGHLTLVDGDRAQLTNCNRQLNALHSTLGKPKVEITAARLLDINPELSVEPLEQYLDPEAMEALLAQRRWDFVVDAIDTLTPKVALLRHALALGLPVVSSMGAGARVQPGSVRLADISKTHHCALAKAVRRELGLLGIRKGLPVVFSEEPARSQAVLPFSGERNKKSTVGTISYMPLVFGCHLAAYVIDRICNTESL
jgi:tRNA A37 threonylcarbamoyladenosine dehydratase